MKQSVAFFLAIFLASTLATSLAGRALIQAFLDRRRRAGYNLNRVLIAGSGPLARTVIDKMRLLQPSSNIRLSRKNPEPFLRRACGIVRKGWGQRWLRRPADWYPDTLMPDFRLDAQQAAHAHPRRAPHQAPVVR